MKRTHLAGSQVAWEIVATVLPIPPLAALGGAPMAAWASLWPDADHDKSSWARSLGPITEWASRRIKTRMGGHRAGMHSLLVGVPLCGLLAGFCGLGVWLFALWVGDPSVAVLWPLVATFAGAGLVGALSHSVLDSFTCNGIACGCAPRRLRRGATLRPWNGQHPAGVEWLWPVIKRRFGLPWVVVDSAYERTELFPRLAFMDLYGAGIMVASWMVRAVVT